jgi:hypothetical protein
MVNKTMQAAFRSIYGPPLGTGEKLAELYDDFRRKRKRFMRFCRTEVNGHDHPHIDQALDSARLAFYRVEAAMFEATGCDRSKACAVLLPDGRLLVHAIDEEDDITDSWTLIQCVRVGRFVELP